MEKQTSIHTLEDIRGMPIKEIAREMGRLRGQYPVECERACDEATSIIEGRTGSRIYDVLVGRCNPTEGESLRVDYACVLRALDCLDLQLDS